MITVHFLQYAFESQIRWHGYDPAVSLLLVKPREVISVTFAQALFPLFSHLTVLSDLEFFVTQHFDTYIAYVWRMGDMPI